MNRKKIVILNLQMYNIYNFEYSIQYIALKNPEKLNWLIRYYDEVFLVINTVCQYQYLKKYGKDSIK